MAKENPPESRDENCRYLNLIFVPSVLIFAFKKLNVKYYVVLLRSQSILLRLLIIFYVQACLDRLSGLLEQCPGSYDLKLNIWSELLRIALKPAPALNNCNICQNFDQPDPTIFKNRQSNCDKNTIL
jgi:hypothetical protein